jgi:hypothetical protein
MVRVVGCLAVLGCSVAIAACDDDDEILFVELDPIVAQGVRTFVDSTVNFSMLRTFAMPDTVVHFTPVTGTPIPASRAYDRAALDRVRQNLLARGYRQIQAPDSANVPSFMVLVGATATQNYDAWVGYVWYEDWGFYPGWGWYPDFDDDWDIVYPWYPVVGTTAYNRGTLIVDLIPTTMVNPLARTIRSAWAGVASGVLDGTQTESTVTAAIDRMFELSPYLRAGTLLSPP